MARYYAGIGILVAVFALCIWAEEHAKRKAGARWHRDR